MLFYLQLQWNTKRSQLYLNKKSSMQLIPKRPTHTNKHVSENMLIVDYITISSKA